MPTKPRRLGKVGPYEVYYDHRKAMRAIDFVQEYLTFTEGKWTGKPFILLKWQKRVFRKLFGYVTPDGNRLYRKCFILVPKKNGKSPTAAAISTYCLFADREPGPRVYLAATTKDQARIVFDSVTQMVRSDEDLDEVSKIKESWKEIEVPFAYHNSKGNLKVLSSDAGAAHGLKPNCVVIDELHAFKKRDLFDVLTKGAGDIRQQPITVIITTAGDTRHSICYQQYKRAKAVKANPEIDPRLLPVLYELDEEDDWRDEKNWGKVNPSLNETFSLEVLRDAYNEAKGNEIEESLFRQLRLNHFPEVSGSKFIPAEEWKYCYEDYKQDSLHSLESYWGLDLASVDDIAAFVGIVPYERQGIKHYQIYAKFWFPEERVKQRVERDGIPYDYWAKHGYITLTKGNRLNEIQILRDIDKIGSLMKVKQINFDRWGANFIQNALASGKISENDGLVNRFTVAQFGQGFASMAPPTKSLLKKVLGHEIHHNNNPVLNWMIDNVVVDQDAAGNYKPNKMKSEEKIDGVVALIMALDGAERNPVSTVDWSKGVHVSE